MSSRSRASPCFSLFILHGLLLWLGCSATAMQAPGDTAQLSSIQHDLGSIRESIYRFWQQHGVDGTFGGFHGTLDRAGASVEPSYKGIVQTARHAWAFSTYYLNGYKSVADAEPYRSSSSSSSSQQMAKTAFDFMLQHLHDPKTGMFHWLVTREGQLLQDNKVIYGQWFAIYSLSQYYTAFRDPRAKELALNCFRAMDAAWHSSQFGAFDETPANGIPPAPSRAAIAEAGAAGKQQQRQQTRTLNVAMHGLEALTALHKMTQDPVVLQRIHETLHILCTRLQRTEGLIYEDYLPTADSSSSKWQPAPGTVVSYGHNLESTWLVADTLDYLLSISAIDQQLAQQYRDTVMSIGAAAVRDGFDSEHGGIYETGLPVKGPVSTVKVWWVQAESLLALWKLHEHGQSTDSSTAAATGSGSESAGPDAGAGGSRDQTGQQGQSEYYLRVLQQTARFVRQYVADGAGGGELFWEVQADGTFKPTDHLERSTKGNMWKASYHSSRSVLFLEQWMSKAGIS